MPCPRGIGCATHGCRLAPHPSPARECLFAPSVLQPHIAVTPSPAAVWCGAGGGKGDGGGRRWGEDTDGEWDDESSGECSGSDDEGMCGFSGRDCQELLCQGVKPGRSSIDVMMFARLIFINLHVLMCEGILGVLDDVSAGVRVSAVLALSRVFVSFFMKSTHVNELACMPACR